MSAKIKKSRKAEAGTCVICSEKCIGRHYGIEACLGCKTFFRRAVIQSNDKEESKCDTRHAPKTCRKCRYRKCLEEGMTRQALKPRRDLLGLGKVTLKRCVNGTNNFDENLVRLVRRLTELDSIIRTRKENLLQGRQDMIDMVDGLSLHNNDEKEEGPMRVTSARDLSYVLEIDLISMLEWSRHLPIFDEMPTSDKMILLKRFSLYHLILEHGFFTSRSRASGLWLVSNGTCWPKNLDELPEPTRNSLAANRKWRQEKLYRDTTTVYIDEVSEPLRRLDITNEELAVLKIILLFPISDIGLSRSTRSKCDSLRDCVVRGLFKHYQSLGYPDYDVRYGNLILMLSGVRTATNVMMECYQLMRLFKIVHFDTVAQLLIFDNPQ